MPRKISLKRNNSTPPLGPIRKSLRSGANVPSPTPTVPLVAATTPLPVPTSVPAINVALNQQSLDVYVLHDLNYEEIHRLKDYLTMASQNGRIAIKASDHIDSKLHKFITLDFKAASIPDSQLWHDWPRDQLIRHLLQLNPPVGDDHAKPAVTLQHQLENLRLAFNPRDPNRTGLKTYSGMLSRIRDEFKADLQTSEISHVKILLDSLKRQSSGDNKPELRELYTRVARKESECITFDTFEEILQAEARDLVASTIAVARMRLLAPRPASSSTPTSRPKPGSHTSNGPRKPSNINAVAVSGHMPRMWSLWT